MPTGGVNGERLIDVVDDGLGQGDVAAGAGSHDGEHADASFDNLNASAPYRPCAFGPAV